MTRLLSENITNLYGEKGKAWIAKLPSIIQSLSDHWNLTSVTPVDNMTYHYVAKAIRDNTQSVVLKIGFDEISLTQEKIALEYFNGSAAIQLIDYNQTYKALLLDQAIPGVTLKSFYPKNAEFVMDCYVQTMKKLHEKKLPDKHSYPHIRDWLTALDKINTSVLPKNMIERAIILKNKLLQSIEQPVFLHGDLHHDNILQHADSWVAIDPKGIVGDEAFEIAAFDFIHPSELENKSSITDLFEQRIHQIAKKSNLDAQRIKDWVFVRLMLSAVWSIEDNGDPIIAIDLVRTIFAESME